MVRVTIEVTREGGAPVLALTTKAESGAGQRTLRGSTCEELLDTAAVVLSLALDAEALYRNERTNTVQAPSKAKQQAPKARAQAVDREVPGFRERPDFEDDEQGRQKPSPLNAEVRASLVSEIGTLPRPALGAAIAVGTNIDAYTLAVEVAQWGEQSTYIDGPDIGARFNLISGRIRVCRKIVRLRPFASLPLAVRGCVLAHAGRLSGEGLVPDPKTSANLLIGGGAEVALALPYQLRMAAGLSSQQNRPRYSVRPDPRIGEDMVTYEVYQPAIVAIQLGLGWGVSF